MSVTLPRTFRPTHATAGLKGYPAVDIFGHPDGGDKVEVRFFGRVRRISGKSCRLGGSPGGAYGQSLYIESSEGDRYLTHLDKLFVSVGDRVKPGTIIGTVCNSAVSGKPNTSHVHYGFKRALSPLPTPKQRLYDVVGPKGNNIAKRKTPAAIAKATPNWVKRFGSVTVRAAR